MKALITTPQLWKIGGVANYYKVLQPYLSDGVEYFTTCRRDGESRFGTVNRLWKDCSNFKKVLDGFDLVHLNPSLGFNAIIRDGLFLRAAKKKGKKVVVFIHGWNKAFEAKLGKRWLWLFKKYYFSADTFIVLANEFKERLRKMGYKGEVITETTTFDDKAMDYYRPAMTVKKQSVFSLLFLSRVEREKGIYEAIKAYRQINEKQDNVVLTVAGDGDELQKAKGYVSANKIKGVEFIGHVRGKEKYQLYNKSDCYLFPTFHGEGMPCSVLEAMAFGLPVITRPVGGLKDFFEDGKMGFITESLEPSVFAGLVEKLIENPQLRKQMAEYNHSYAKKRFMASKVAKRLEDIYRQVLNV